MTDDARQRLAEGQRLLDSGEPDAALEVLNELSTHPDPGVAGAALLAVGSARYRNDDEDGALTAWLQAAELGGPTAWLGWRSAAEQHVRNGDLEDAIGAYREADRRAPAQERGAIANRIAWLLKETGHDFAARRQFNRARGAYATFPAYVTWAIIAVNVAVFVADAATGGGGFGLFSAGGGNTEGACGIGSPMLSVGTICRDGIAAGEWWRLITSAFLHLGALHIAFNMYALWLFGPIIEQLYGHFEYLVLYLLCALGGSVLTILAAPDIAAAGASGAIFGLFGLAFVVSRRRHLLLGPQARAILSQAGGLLMLNLIITFAVPGISWTGHVGGLLVGAFIGLLLVPSNVPTMGGLWRAPDGKPLAGGSSVTLRVGAYALVAAILAAGTLFAISPVA
jgi:membrane associated rhomboid family serine protease